MLHVFDVVAVCFYTLLDSGRALGTSAGRTRARTVMKHTKLIRETKWAIRMVVHARAFNLDLQLSMFPYTILPKTKLSTTAWKFGTKECKVE